jgi:Ni/Co efflux regulator RcnB
MKKFILAAIAATLVASPALAAAPQQHHDRGYNGRPQAQKVVKKTVYRPAAQQYRSDWKRGQRFDSRYARNYRQVDYRQYRGLRAPPRGYRYVQSGNDAVLVGVTSGIIAAIFSNILR